MSRKFLCKKLSSVPFIAGLIRLVHYPAKKTLTQVKSSAKSKFWMYLWIRNETKVRTEDVIIKDRSCCALNWFRTFPHFPLSVLCDRPIFSLVCYFVHNFLHFSCVCWVFFTFSLLSCFMHFMLVLLVHKPSSDFVKQSGRDSNKERPYLSFQQRPVPFLRSLV